MDLKKIRITPTNHFEKDILPSSLSLEEQMVLLDENNDVIRFFDSNLEDPIKDVGGEYVNMLSSLGIPPHTNNGWFSYEAIQPSNILFFTYYNNSKEDLDLREKVSKVKTLLKDHNVAPHGITDIIHVLGHFSPNIDEVKTSLKNNASDV